MSDLFGTAQVGGEVFINRDEFLAYLWRVGANMVVESEVNGLDPLLTYASLSTIKALAEAIEDETA